MKTKSRTLMLAIALIASMATMANSYEDKTSLITNPSFNSNNAEGWSGTTPQFQTYGNAEFYNTTFDFHQSLSGLQNGVYKVSVKGFYRAGDYGNAAYSFHEESTTSNLHVKLYAKTESGTRLANIQSICEGETSSSICSGTVYNDYGYIPNNMESGHNYCDAGYYKDNTVYCKVSDGTLIIGIKKTTFIDYDWTLFDDWTLTYLGEDAELPDGEEEGLPQFDSIILDSPLPINFKNDELHPWTIEGSTAIIRGDGSSTRSSSWLVLSYSSETPTEFSFDWAMYNYSSHTSLQVYVDGAYKANNSSSSYSTRRYYLDAGEHVIAFRDSMYNYTGNWSGIKNVKVKQILPLETAVLTANSKPLTFTNDDTWPWTIEDGYIQSTNYGTAYSSSKFSSTFTIDSMSVLSFDRRVAYVSGSDYSSSYSDYHRLYFRIKGDLGRNWWNSYLTSFGTLRVPLEPGTYSVEWEDTIYNSTYKLVSQVRNIQLLRNWVDVEMASSGTLGVEVLYKVNVLNDVEMLKVKGSLNSSDWNDIQNMKNLVALDLSEATIENIPDNAFNGLSSLSWVKLPEGLTTIGQYAFKGTQIFSIEIPSTVTTIGYMAFANTRITKVTFKEDSQLTTISNGAFYNCTALGGIIMPNTVTSVGYAAFQACTSLKTMIFSDAMTTIWDYTCDGCTALKTLHLPNNLKTIRYRGFYNTPNLLKVTMPSTINRIYDYAFYNCGLDSLLLPVTMQYLHQYAFDECKNLKYIELPSYLASGSSSTTYYYANSNGVTSSSRTMYYGYNYIFTDCPAIETIVMRSATPPAITNDPFSNARAKSAITLIVPSFAVVNYKLDNYWYQFGNIVEGDDIDYWKITSALSLTNNRRMQGKPDIDLYYGGQFTVGGNAPMESGVFNLYVSESNPGRLLNTCEAMTADSINTYFSVESERWYFITPLHDVDLTKVTVSNGASYVFRYYDGSSRATNGTGSSWRNVDNGKLTAGQGYIFRCNASAVISFPAEASVHSQVFNTSDVTKQLSAYEAAASANKSWNFVGNPYPCYFDIYYMDFTAPITVWTGSTYKAYSIVDDNFALRPMQAFFVQKPDAVDNIIFHKEGRQLTSDINHSSETKAFRAQSNNNRYFFELKLVDDEQADETRVVVNSEASPNYEIERDASKFMSFETAVPQLFTLDVEGNNYAINERPLDDGRIQLAYYTGQSGYLTISATRADGEIYLYDSLLSKTVNLMSQDYTFHSDATEGVNTSRFMLKLNVADAPTVISRLNENGEAGDSSIFDLQGRKVLNTSKKGIYIWKGNKVVRQ